MLAAIDIPSAVRRIAILSSTLLRTIIAFAVVAVVVAIPLFTVYRSKCPDRGGKEANRYSFVAPWDDPPRDCGEAENGFEIVRGYVGLD